MVRIPRPPLPHPGPKPGVKVDARSERWREHRKKVRGEIVEAVFPSIDFATNSAREIIQRSAEEYVSLVDEHPNVLRFFIQGRFPEQSESTMRTLNEGREITLAMAEMFNNELREMELDPAAFELAAFAAFGAAHRPPIGGWAPTSTARGGCRGRSSSST